MHQKLPCLTSYLSKVTGYRGDDQLPAALTGAHLVVIPAGVPRKPGMTRDDLFNINAGIVKGIATAIAKYVHRDNHAFVVNSY